MKKLAAQWREKVALRFRSLRKRLRARAASLPSFGTARMLLFALCVFMLVGLVYLAQSSNAALVARNLRVKQLKIQEIERENAQLRYEIAALASPSAIEQRARKLGLGPAKQVVYANMPWIQPAPNELMPAFLPQVNSEIPIETLNNPNDGTVLEQLLTMLGLASLADRVNAQGQ